mmetsp:Transcript_22245/g.40959  ORF Transcript_22245/g.40959 Transcript_22245/m.40959 type:complete len:266 (-) Transcript_22245:114-911(-)
MASTTAAGSSGRCALSARQLQQPACLQDIREALPFREIRAIHDARFVRVYQAYNDEIADAAVAANSFHAPLTLGVWSKTRMTWVKPSAVWMAYRCGWTLMKDKNQRRVLALDIAREKFEELLMHAQLSHGSKCREGKVVVQWDPERRLHPSAASQKEALTHSIQGVRSIQIGIRGAGVEALLDPEVVLQISDVTEAFRTAGEALMKSPPDLAAATEALWPEGVDEVQMELKPELREVLQMDVPDLPAEDINEKCSHAQPNAATSD